MSLSYFVFVFFMRLTILVHMSLQCCVHPVIFHVLSRGAR